MSEFVEKSKAAHRLAESKSYWPYACVPNHNDDTRRHHEILAHGFGLVRGLNPSNILSIGDSRARDAAFGKQLFGCQATASDLNVSQLHQAVVDGFVDAVCDVDVESIPFSDNHFDLVVAKETFHHWPRPFLGLYEMLRVSRQAVLLIEPFDCSSAVPTPYVETGQYHDSYEEVGNYKYQLSLREILKCAWAMGLPAVSAVGLNDPYDPKQSFKEWLSKKEHLDDLGNCGQRQFNLMAVALYKNDQFAKACLPDNKIKSKMYWQPRL
jgi:SAM-dependent methyltransferase